MAWDTRETRRRLLEAGARQFAAHGLAGARMDRIEQDAGVNRERVYRYFGNKQSFFTAVLEHELSSLLDGLEFPGDGAAAVTAFAAGLFDRCVERPDLPRLLAWESLELGDVVAADTRRRLCSAQAADLSRTLGGLGRQQARELLLSIVTLVIGTWTLHGVAESVLGSRVDPVDRRGDVLAQVHAMADRLTR